MISLGIDSSTKTGIVVLDGLTVLEASELSSAKKFLHGVDRALNLSDQVSRVIERHNPELIVIEGYGYSNQHTLVPLVEIGTALRIVFRLMEKKFEVIPPTSLKKVITGSGVAKKDHIILEVFKRWGYEAKTNNIADAFGLAIVGQELLGVDTGLPKAHKECLSKIKSLK